MARRKEPDPKPPKDFSVYQLWAWVLLLWSLYRFFVPTLPEAVDELICKPLVFVLPVFWYVRKKEKRPLSSLGLTIKRIFPALYTGLGIGMIFALEGILANYIKYGTLTINPIDSFKAYGFWLLPLSLATAFSEEVLSRGLVFRRIYEQKKHFASAAVLSTLMFVLLHIPILVTTHRYTGMVLVLYLATGFVLGIANSIVFIVTGSLVAPILVHLFWNMTVALYL